MIKVNFKMLSLFILSILAFGCSSDDDSSGNNRLLGKTFVFPVVQSQAECDAEQEVSVVFNCAQYLIFETSSHVDVIFTDVANDATYVVNGNTVTITVEDPDVVLESPLVFTINQESNILTRISDSSSDLWKLEREGVYPWDL